MFLPAVERLLLVAWVGALWGVGYVAVPVLFTALEDRALAGALAGQMFHVVSYLGLAAGMLLVAIRLARRRSWRDWRLVVLGGMLLLTLAGEFAVQPRIAGLKADKPIPEGGERAARFARLHGIASILYLTTSLGGVVLVGAGSRSPTSDDAERG